MTVRRIACALAIVTSVAWLGACDSGSSNSLPPPAVITTPSTTPPATLPPTQECENTDATVASYAPTRPLGDLPPGSYMEKIRQRGRLIAGVSADTLLFGFRNPLTGQLEGFDIDLVKRIARQLWPDDDPSQIDSRIEFRVMTYAQRIPALRAKNNPVDIVADVMTVNCSRWQLISFSSQYFDAGQRILVRKNSNARTITDLEGTRMCVAKGSTNEEELQKKYPEIIAVGVDDISDCMVLFQRGEVDSVTGDDTVLAGFVTQDPYTKIIPPANQDPLTSEPYGLGIAKENRDFVEYVNAVLEDVRTSGDWERWYEKHYKVDDAPAPPPAAYGRIP
jgi:polar amino acid transport system substrate-binding protein